MQNPKVAEFKHNLKTYPNWVEHAILAIYKQQTSAEQNAGRTIEDNGVGFTGVDSEILSSFAKQLLTPGYRLSPKQLVIAFRLMPKYAGQLCDIAGIPRTVKKPKASIAKGA